MGLSASQARLLSITTRLSHNELESQMISNSKVRLTDQTQRASEEYIDALSATKLMYTTYDDEGNSTQVSLTPAVMYAYSSAKNQYAIMNNNNQIMVSSEDAKNYEETSNLLEFLERYDVIENKTISTSKKVFDEDSYNKAYKTWKDSEPDKTIPNIKTIQVRDHSDSAVYNAIQNFVCFKNSVDRDNCFMHVLAALLGTGTHTTSDGNTFEIRTTDQFCGHDHDGDGDITDDPTWCWNTCDSKELNAITAEQRVALKNDTCSSEKYDTGTLCVNYGGTDYEVPCKGDGSDYETYKDNDNVYQKIVDLLWEVHNSYTIGDDYGGRNIATDEDLEKFFYLIEFDLGESTWTTKEIQDGTKNNPDYITWQNSEPKAEDYTKEEISPLGYATLKDKDKAQWYTNLWYLMNKQETSEILQENTKQYESSTTGELEDYTCVEFENITKSTGSNGYEVLESNLFTSKEWLQFALEHGCATIYKTQYNNPATDCQEVVNVSGEAINWSSIIHTSAVDITTVEDEAAITKAEAEYTNKLNEIEAKDTKYDNEIKKLDTEHNALQTEYDSLKTIISKNTERSFKAFS